MDVNSRMYAHVMFQNKVLLASGSQYEDLFSDVMTRRYSDFKQIRPYGNMGDRKNDGYIKSLGRYFQVYAPLAPETKENEAAKKAKEDFEGLLEYWEKIAPVVEYSFVFNDRFKGSNAPLEATLADIEQEHELDACGAFLTKDLANEFDQLEDHLIAVVIKSVIPHSSELSNVDYGVMTDVVQHVMDSLQPLDEESLMVAPDFDEKIQINNLPIEVGLLLRTGSFQSGAVESYFDTHAEFSRGAVRDHFARAYEDAKAATDTPAQAFFRLLETTTPPAAVGAEKLAQDATIVLIAYYFETCDVFEDPTS